ncbi:hypothetical protein P3K87_10220 [Bacillus cytotoxicus]
MEWLFKVEGGGDNLKNDPSENLQSIIFYSKDTKRRKISSLCIKQ